jgi:hypothetical protein
MAIDHTIFTAAAQALAFVFPLSLPLSCRRARAKIDKATGIGTSAGPDYSGK